MRSEGGLGEALVALGDAGLAGGEVDPSNCGSSAPFVWLAGTAGGAPFAASSSMAVGSREVKVRGWFSETGSSSL